MTRPAISVIVPAYDREAYIGEALASLQSERTVEIEIVVVDDGSTDGTVAVVRREAASDARIRLIESPHGGVSKARNIGLEAARGPFIAFLDSDDISAPGRLGRQFAKLDTRPDVWGVTGHLTWFTELTKNLQPVEGTLWRHTLGFSLCNILLRREVFDLCGTFDENLAFAEDIDMYFRLFEADAPILVEVETAIYHRRHASNMTRDGRTAALAMAQVHYRSVKRRQLSGRAQPPQYFGYRPVPAETLFGIPRPVGAPVPQSEREPA